VAGGHATTWRLAMGNLGYPAFGDDVKVKDRTTTALNMRFGGGRHCKASEGVAAERNN
jgi:hypothetical protein